MNKIVFLFPIAGVLTTIYLLFPYFIYSSKSALMCEKKMLNEFAWEMDSSIESLIGNKYSETLVFSVPESYEIGQKTIVTEWVLNTSNGPVKHVVTVPSLGICPSLYGGINVVIPKESAGALKAFVSALRMHAKQPGTQ